MTENRGEEDCSGEGATRTRAGSVEGPLSTAPSGPAGPLRGQPRLQEERHSRRPREQCCVERGNPAAPQKANCEDNAAAAQAEVLLCHLFQLLCFLFSFSH